MHDVAVIGAGPYGLATAAHLRARGQRIRVFGDTMSAWRCHMPAGMLLKSTPRASNISSPAPGTALADFCHKERLPPLVADDDVIPVEVFAAYGDWFARAHGIEVEPAAVRRVAKAGSGFELELDSGETCSALTTVVATGHVAHTYVPFALRSAVEQGRCTHTADHRDLSTFAGRSVVVIGGGQSALESAALLHETGAHATVLVRSNVVRWGTPPAASAARWYERLHKPPSGLGPGWSLRTLCDGAALVRYAPSAGRRELVRRVLGPAGAWWLRQRVDGHVDVRTGTRIVTVHTDGSRTKLVVQGPRGTSELTTDHVLAATGYHVDVRALDFLAGHLEARVRTVHGAPALDAHFSSSVPGLYFTGLAAAQTFGPLLRFVHGTRFAAPRVAAGIAAATAQLRSRRASATRSLARR